MNYFKLNYSGDQINETISSYIDEKNVPINDIYECFKSYWNAVYKNDEIADQTYKNYPDPFIYASVDSTDANSEGYQIKIDNSGNIVVDMASGLTNIGRRNAMWFGGSTQRIPLYAFNPTYVNGNLTYKLKQPINCSTLASLCVLGIPYDESRYGKARKAYNITNPYTYTNSNGNPVTIPAMYKDENDEIVIKNSFNFFGKDIPIDSENYNAYFITPRMLGRFQELGLEQNSLHLDWYPKNSLADTWYDYIAPSSDLREAKQGDLIFWNNNGESTKNPRRVSHVVLVLDRLSFDSHNPNQPLLLVAEATSTSDIGVQVSYYMYDTSSQSGALGTNEHLIPKFICRPKYKRLTSTPYKDISPVDMSKTYEDENQITQKYYSVTRPENSNSVVIYCRGTERRLMTIELDWIPKANDNFLSIKHGTKEIFRHYISNSIAGCKYQKIKIVVPLQAWVSTSKQDQITEMKNQITITEGKGSDSTNTTTAEEDSIDIDIDNVKIYEGIKLYNAGI